MREKQYNRATSAGKATLMMFVSGIAMLISGAYSAGMGGFDSLNVLEKLFCSVVGSAGALIFLYNFFSFLWAGLRFTGGSVRESILPFDTDKIPRKGKTRVSAKGNKMICLGILCIIAVVIISFTSTIIQLKDNPNIAVEELEHPVALAFIPFVGAHIFIIVGLFMRENVYEESKPSNNPEKSIGIEALQKKVDSLAEKVHGLADKCPDEAIKISENIKSDFADILVRSNNIEERKKLVVNLCRRYDRKIKKLMISA